MDYEVRKERPPWPKEPPETFEPSSATRDNAPYDIILRYQESMWWGRSVFYGVERKWVYEQGPPIGSRLMFEMRCTEGPSKNEDEWNFGMCWFERRIARGKVNWYLWATASVRYMGFGIRKSEALLSLQEKRS